MGQRPAAEVAYCLWQSSRFSWPTSAHPLQPPAEGRQPPSLAIANNNSICQVLQSSQEHARLCDPYCGDAHYKDWPETLQKLRDLKAAALVPGRGDALMGEIKILAELMGNQVQRLYDVGVAGLPRLIGERSMLAAARVIVVVAGMEGALPSVVSGLVSVPVIAVPTSVGYGASFGGLAALLGMLNSCASGVSVVNIDNGFGAASIASLINHL